MKHYWQGVQLVPGGPHRIMCVNCRVEVEAATVTTADLQTECVSLKNVASFTFVVKKCTCGSAAVGSPKHSSWC